MAGAMSDRAADGGEQMANMLVSLDGRKPQACDRDPGRAKARTAGQHEAPACVKLCDTRCGRFRRAIMRVIDERFPVSFAVDRLT